jgi:DNA topoisomerase I|tara:strand:- start:11965 stop:14295 length:2331 start_codon:yes stop_codon:yes gene_type:complete
MGKNLVIVESPAKAKTIEGYLGSEYEVKSSYGHIRDLPKDAFSIDVENDFEPTYEISADKKELIKDLIKSVKRADMVYLASDDDREGEAISWHLSKALELNEHNTRRIVFREITKNAIKNAIENPRIIDQNLVDAQQARRVLDRLVGYELSPILWKKIKYGLSAGRVQSVSVRLIVEREREISNFNATSHFKVFAIFDLGNGKFLKAELPKKFNAEPEAQAFLEKCKGAEFTITDLITKPAKKSPAPPFTTSTLQQEAARKLGFPVSMTMQVAQKLYEAGKISYMRTDSLNLSNDAIEGATSMIVNSFGTAFSEVRKFKTKSQGAQEAHEAIRPTDFTQQTGQSDSAGNRLYELIWKRAIASQMSDAQLEKTTATIGISTTDEQLIASGEVIKFEGFLKVYLESRDEDDEEDQKDMLPPLLVGQLLVLKQLTAKQGYTRAQPRYSEASLVKKLEEMGIGRPSTYAPTISTIIKRDYVEKESREGHERSYRELVLTNDQVTTATKVENTGAEKNKLFPTNTAMVVNDFLVANFPAVIDLQFTAKVEQEFDDIANGKINWVNMIRSFYTNFHARVEESDTIKRSDVSNRAREIGIDPTSGKAISARLGKFGAYVQIGELDTEEKPTYASLRKGQFIDSITLEEALELFKLPRIIGEFEGEEIQANVGRFGPYVRHSGKFISLKPDQDPHEINAEEAITLILEKREEDANKFIKSFDEDQNVMVVNGKFGPYIKFGKKNVKIPKDKLPESLTFEECKLLADATPDKKGGRKKPAAKKKN